MDKKPNTYTREFKLEAVRLALFANICKSHLALEIGINSGTLQNWIWQFSAEVTQKANAETTIPVDYETMLQLVNKNQSLQYEREILLHVAALYLNGIK